MREIQSVRDVLHPAEKDFRRRIYQEGIFDREDMRDLAASVSREYMGAISDETLLRLAEHDTWLRNGKFHGPQFGQKREYPGDSLGIIAEQLYHFIKHNLRHVIDSFWEGQTTAVFTVTRDRVELVGFFDEERPSEEEDLNDPFEKMLGTQHAPYA